MNFEITTKNSLSKSLPKNILTTAFDSEPPKDLRYTSIEIRFQTKALKMIKEVVLFLAYLFFIGDLEKSLQNCCKDFAYHSVLPLFSTLVGFPL